MDRAVTAGERWDKLCLPRKLKDQSRRTSWKKVR